MIIKRTIGNKELWGREKTLFLTSQRAPLGCYEKVFRWVEEFDRGQCAVCFNTSELEEEVLKALLVCHVPTVLVVTGSFNDTYNVQIEQALKENRLLVLVLQREESDGRGYIARLRNWWVIRQVQHIVCGYINPKGSIFGLIAGRNDVSYLLDKTDLKAAEATEKPYRWTVSEDKRLLRMFYEDMGIHAIHKAIGRPYSSVYRHVKSLTMNDEVLKGREFEDYVLEHLGVEGNDKLTLKEWRGDKSLPGIYPEGNSNPDLVFEYNGHHFAIECKWRSHLPKDISKELLPPDRVALFEKYAKKNKLPVFLLLGIDGLPSDPYFLYLIPIRENLSATDIINEAVKADQLIESIESRIPKNNHIQQEKAKHANAYARWNEADDSLLKQLYLEGKTVNELMAQFGRNRGSITFRLHKLNLT